VILPCTFGAPACKPTLASKAQVPTRVPTPGAAVQAAPLGAEARAQDEPPQPDGDSPDESSPYQCKKDDRADCKRRCAEHRASACSYLGVLLAHDHDLAGALAYYRQGCEGGNPYGCYPLGRLYELGKGVATDKSKAALYFQTACDAHNAEACSELGMLYHEGEGVARDLSEAARFFDLACMRGDAMGCGNIGSAYLAGEGVPRDCVRARSMYLRACVFGLDDACAILEGRDVAPRVTGP
jgi:TPR repeat protein